MSGFNDFAPFNKKFGCFIVKNVNNDRNKVIKIFNYPILHNTSRDLLAIPGVSESDIRASLLKGELKHKILANEIIVECSDIDLLQFNDEQRALLENAGISKGLQVTNDNLAFIKKEDVMLLGTVDGVNTIFLTPTVFVYDADHKIIVYKNGVKQLIGDDFTIFESSGPGTGYDGVILTVPPTVIPTPTDVITADYYINNI